MSNYLLVTRPAKVGEGETMWQCRGCGGRSTVPGRDPLAKTNVYHFRGCPVIRGGKVADGRQA